MLSPLIRRAGKSRNRIADARSKERGVTIALVAVAMVGIIAMAALSIDIGTLYQAKAEAQRAADAAALTAARMISISGVTGDPGNAAGSWQLACGTSGTATLAAIAVAQSSSNFLGGAQPSTVTVSYGPGSASTDCSTLAGPGSTFSVNPVVTVYVQQAKVPTFFGRIFALIPGGTSSNSGVSATATAEVYNPSGSGSLASGMVPVKPRCVKPWIVPNVDPGAAPNPLVNTTGTIVRTGIYPAGVIGESFFMNAGCTSPGTVGTCTLGAPPGYTGGVLQYVPAWVQNPSSAVPKCKNEANWTASNYQQAIAGCDQSTLYACGTPLGSYVDLTENPVNPAAGTGDTATGAACLTNSTVGPDQLTPTPLTYPFQITAGAGNPLSAQGVTGLITTSNSIVTIPIYDNTIGTLVGAQPQVTILGFLQVFINSVDPATGNMYVTVMNVSGCSNAATAQAVAGSSPVPVRLITPP
jgi:Flp pilus assembly protein TadG